MDLKKVAIIKPARGNYGVGTTYAYHSEIWECVTGVFGDAVIYGGVGAGAGGALVGGAAVIGLTLSGPVGWGIIIGLGALGTLGGAASGYADHC